MLSSGGKQTGPLGQSCGFLHKQRQSLEQRQEEGWKRGCLGSWQLSLPVFTSPVLPCLPSDIMNYSCIYLVNLLFWSSYSVRAPFPCPHTYCFFNTAKGGGEEQEQGTRVCVHTSGVLQNVPTWSENLLSAFKKIKVSSSLPYLQFCFPLFQLPAVNWSPKILNGKFQK